MDTPKKPLSLQIRRLRGSLSTQLRTGANNAAASDTCPAKTEGCDKISPSDDTQCVSEGCMSFPCNVNTGSLVVTQTCACFSR